MEGLRDFPSASGYPCSLAGAPDRRIRSGSGRNDRAFFALESLRPWSTRPLFYFANALIRRTVGFDNPLVVRVWGASILLALVVGVTYGAFHDGSPITAGCFAGAARPHRQLQPRK